MIRQILLYIVSKNIKNAKKLNGKNVIDLFNNYRAIDYINDYYDALHTTGRQYIVDDIDMYIKVHQ